MTGNFIAKIRREKKLSQDFVATKLGISRPTYIQIEKGIRDISLNEAQKLSDLFDMPVNAFIEGQSSRKYVVNLPVNEEKVPEDDIRISVPQKNLEKFKEVFLYILEKVGAKPNVGQSVIYKLLYFIDFDFYEKYEKQLIGATYIKNHHGPTPVEFVKIADSMKKKGEIEEVKSKYFQYDQTKYLPHRSANLNLLTGLEKEHIDDVLARLSDKSGKELRDYSHDDVPWQIHKDGEIISYESVFYRDHKYSVRNYEDEL